MPPLLSCLLGKRLCEDTEKEDHWSLRDRCATLTADICRKFGNVYATLVPRVTKTLVKTLTDPQKPIPSHYGAIVGITALGPHAIDTLLLPNIEVYCKALGACVQDGDQMTDSDVIPDQPTPAEIGKCRSALKNAASRWINEAYMADLAEHQSKRELLRSLFNL